MEPVVDGMKIAGKEEFKCSTCAQGKMAQFRSYVADKKATKPLELVHSDLAGPITPISIDNSRYVIVFVDDFSGLTTVYFLRNKSDAVGATAKFLADMSPHGSVKTLRTDNGTEYTSNEFKSLMVKNKIRQEFSAPYSPHQNGTAERSWRSLFDMARCFIIQADLPKKLWNYAVRNASYTRNRCYNRRTGKTPYEMFTLAKPDISNLHVFGSTCFAYVQNKQKLDPRSEEGLFIGHDSSSPAFLIYFPVKDEIRRVRCVVFHDKMPSSKPDDDGEFGHHPVGNNVDPEPVSNSPNNVIDVPEMIPGPTESSPVSANEGNNQSGRKYPTRERKKPSYFTDYIDPEEEPAIFANCTIDYFYKICDPPKTYKEAISSDDADEWKTAMETEMSALVENDTFELTKRPVDREVIGGRWVYSTKKGPKGEKSYKARYVAKGYSQIENIDYKETFSPTARMSSVRTLLGVAVQDTWVVHQMDVKSAYLNAPLDQGLDSRKFS